MLQLKADSVGFGWMNFRARYEYGNRSGSGLDEASLIQIGEQPAMRHYDVANRTRNRFVGQVDVVPNEALTFSVSGGFGSDEFDDSYFGLQDAGFRNVTLSADYVTPNGFGVGGSYDYERYSGLQRSRSASSDAAEQIDPNRDWTVDSKERVHYFSIYVYPPRIGDNTEMRVAYEYAHARGNFFYEVGPALRAAVSNCRRRSTSSRISGSTCAIGCRDGWWGPCRTSTSRPASSTSRSIPA